MEAGSSGYDEGGSGHTPAFIAGAVLATFFFPLIGPCVGGPEIGASGRNVPGSTTKFVMPCAISGTETTP